jgi:hypothetical protein
MPCQPSKTLKNLPSSKKRLNPFSLRKLLSLFKTRKKISKFRSQIFSLLRQNQLSRRMHPSP